MRQATEFPLPAPERVEPYLLIFPYATGAFAGPAIKVSIETAAVAMDTTVAIAVKGTLGSRSADRKAADGYACGHESHHDFLHFLLSFLF